MVTVECGVTVSTSDGQSCWSGWSELILTHGCINSFPAKVTRNIKIGNVPRHHVPYRTSPPDCSNTWNDESWANIDQTINYLDCGEAFLVTQDLLTERVRSISDFYVPTYLGIAHYCQHWGNHLQHLLLWHVLSEPLSRRCSLCLRQGPILEKENSSLPSHPKRRKGKEEGGCG